MRKQKTAFEAFSLFFFPCWVPLNLTRGVISRCSGLPAELLRPIHGERTNLLSSSTRERNETQNEMNCELWKYKCNEDVTIAVILTE